MRPRLDLQGTAAGPSIAVVGVTIPLLQELLKLGLLELRTVDPCVVLQLAWSLDAVVQRLTVGIILIATMAFAKLAPFLRQRDRGGVAVDKDGLDQPGFAEVLYRGSRFICDGPFGPSVRGCGQDLPDDS